MSYFYPRIFIEIIKTAVYKNHSIARFVESGQTLSFGENNRSPFLSTKLLIFKARIIVRQTGLNSSYLYSLCRFSAIK